MDETVDITIPEEKFTISPQPDQEESKEPTEPEKKELEQPEVKLSTQQNTATNFDDHLETFKEQVVTPKLEEKHAGGRPCEACTNKENILRITREYIDLGKNEEKPRMVYINELAIRLGCYRDIISEWRSKKKEDGTLEHKEFSDMIKELESIQELRLQQRTMGRYNPTGAIFLLKTKHKYIETEKQLLGSDRDQPLQIELIEEKNIHE